MEIEASTIAVTNNNPSGDGSFTAAVTAARDGDTINLDAISGQTIALTGALPSLELSSFISIINSGAPVIVDGVNAGFTDGITIGAYSLVGGLRLINFQKNGLVLKGEGSTVSKVAAVGNKENGLVVRASANSAWITGVESMNNLIDGIAVEAATNVRIDGACRIQGNRGDGISLNGTTHSRVGMNILNRSTIPASRFFGPPLGSEEHMVISGNGAGATPGSIFGVGVRINGGESNVVTGCYVGINADGTLVERNAKGGIHVINSSHNIIGAAYPGGGNLISSARNTRGVLLEARTGHTTTGNQVLGNIIGANPAGTALIGGSGNGTGPGVGIEVFGASGNQIGGNRATGPLQFPSGRSNLISGNVVGVGIYSSTLRASRNVVQGNYIGTNAAGTALIRNDAAVELQDAGNANVIGGPLPGDGNVIAGSRFANFANPGVLIFFTPGPTGGPGTIVQGNFIGTDLTGTLNLGNAGAGIEGIHCSDSSLLDNLIRNNGGAGCSIDGTATSAINNKIVANSIHSNNGLGIDLGADGVTANDAGDGDSGPNNRQNHPTIGSVTTQNGVTTAEGTLAALPSGTYKIEWASNPLGGNQGENPLGSTTMTTDANGNATGVASLPPVPAGHTLTATATDSTGNTSEFSALSVVTGSAASADLQLFCGVISTANPRKGGVELSLWNLGPDNATAVRLEGLLTVSIGKAAVTSVTTTLGEAILNGNNITVNIPTLAKGGNAFIAIGVAIDEDALVAACKYGFSATAFTPDPKRSNNVATGDYRLRYAIAFPSELGFREPTGGVPVLRAGSDSQTTTASVAITLPEPSTEIIVVDFETVDGTAVAGQDYGAISGTLIFPPGSTSQSIPLTIFDDDTLEGDETFLIKFSNPLNGRLEKTQLVAVIGASDGGVSTPNQLANISTRLAIGTGPNVLIGGFIIPPSSQSTDVKKVILRAIGPSLTFNGTLANPTLTLFDGNGAPIGRNDNWRSTQIGGVITSDNVAAIEASTIPPTHDNESAMVVDLSAGSYTAIVRGVNDTTGIAVVEAYDLDTAGPLRLANIATRGFVDTGDNVMIGGTITLGSSAQNILVRAIGPSLGAAGVGGALQNPTLELRDGNGALVASNDDWRTDQEAAIIATTIPPSNNAESAILSSLTPGAYTAIVRGQGGATGVGLVEFYNLGTVTSGSD